MTMKTISARPMRTPRPPVEEEPPPPSSPALMAKKRNAEWARMPPVQQLRPEEIKRLRTDAQLSQKLFAMALNVERSIVGKWERGETRPSGPSLKLLNVVLKKGVQGIL